jgi:hypothetical protein
MVVRVEIVAYCGLHQSFKGHAAFVFTVYSSACTSNCRRNMQNADSGCIFTVLHKLLRSMLPLSSERSLVAVHQRFGGTYRFYLQGIVAYTHINTWEEHAASA